VMLNIRDDYMIIICCAPMKDGQFIPAGMDNKKESLYGRRHIEHPKRMEFAKGSWVVYTQRMPRSYPYS
jgi:hypothetical protein